MRILPILFVILSGSTLAAAEPGTSEYLLEACRQAVKVSQGAKDVDAVGAGYCYGYLSGVLDALPTRERVVKLQGFEADVCIPSTVQNIQLAKALVQLLEGDPPSLNASPWSNTWLVLRQEYPCR